MIEAVIANRYARGLAEYAHEQGELETVKTDLDRLADIMDPGLGEISVPELMDFLRSPTVPEEEKIKLTDIVCDQLDIGKATSDFLNILILRSRIGLVPFIVRAYSRIAAEINEVLGAVVETARPLSEKQREDLRAALAEATGATVCIEERLQPEIISGLRVRLDDTMLDGSALGRYKRLEALLTQG